MAKTKKTNQAVEDQAAIPESASIPESAPEEMCRPGSVFAGQPLQVELERDRLWELYVARVAKAETVATMRCNGRAIFRDAFLEAKVALDVYLEQTKTGES